MGEARTGALRLLPLKKVSLLLTVLQTSLPFPPFAFPPARPQAFPALSAVSVGYADLHVSPLVHLFSSPHPSPLGSVSLSHASMSLDLFCSFTLFIRFHMRETVYTRVSLTGSLSLA